MLLAFMTTMLRRLAAVHFVHINLLNCREASAFGSLITVGCVTIKAEMEEHLTAAQSCMLHSCSYKDSMYAGCAQDC